MRSASRSAVLFALPLLACKPTAAPLQAPAAPTSASVPTTPTPPPAANTPPPIVVYGHVRIPSPTGFLSALHTSPLPASQRSFFEESSFRSLASLALGSRSAVAEHVDLTRPMGCVITSFRTHAIPVACVVGYQGGLPRLVQDLGPQGFINGADDHAAYRFEGTSVYLAAMGDHVAFAFAPDLIAATRDRLQRELVDAPAGDEELLVTAFPHVIFADASDQILAFTEQIARAQPPTGNASVEAMQEAQRKQWQSWGELERADMWLDVTPDHVRLGYRGTAQAGSATERAYAAARAVAPLAPARSLMARLPTGTLLTMGMRFDTASLAEDPMLGAYVQALGTMGGADSPQAEQYRKGMAMWSELSTGEAAGAMLHERGTKGGVVFVYGVRPGIDAAARMREYFKAQQDLPAAQPDFTTEIRPGALRVGKLRADVVTMTPTAAFSSTPGGASVVQALGESPRLQLAFTQRGDTFIMAMAPTKVDRYLRRALAANDGKATLADVTAAKPVLQANAGNTMTITASMSAIVRWLDQLDVIPPPKVPIPERLDDLVVSMRPAGERQREVTVDLSATMLEALFRLGA